MMMIPNESFSPESGGRVKARMAMDAIRMQGIIRLKKLKKKILSGFQKSSQNLVKRTGYNELSGQRSLGKNQKTFFSDGIYL